MSDEEWHIRCTDCGKHMLNNNHDQLSRRSDKYLTLNYNARRDYV